MTKKLPPFLRLHVAEEAALPPSPMVVDEAFAPLAAAFAVATGWTLDPQSHCLDTPASRPSRVNVTSADQQAANSDNASPIERWRAAQLADAISDLLTRLDTLRSAVWHREAELAIGVPVSPSRQEEAHLAARLDVMLRNGADAVGCQAAGLYLLDDTTTQLKLRACWGLSKDRLLAPPRPLAEASAELEALVGHAVVLEDAGRLPNWKIPEPFPAALCLPLASPTDPLGTIWFFADRVRDFSDREIHLAEIIAGSIAAELQREVLLSECLASKHADRQLVRAVRWQQDHLPTVKPLVDDWSVSGWSATDDDLATGFYDWFVPPDGSLAAAFCTCDGLHVESALTAGMLQAGVRAHGEYAHDAAKLVARVNETIWNSSAGGHTASLFYCKATPGSGRIEYAAAGALQAILVQRSNVELIHTASARLGVEPEIRPELARLQMEAGDLLLVLDCPSLRPSQELELSRRIRVQRAASAEELLRLVRSMDLPVDLALILQRH